MERLTERIRQSLNESLIGITISNPRRSCDIKRYKIRPVLLKGKVVFQSAAYTKTQVFHENLSAQQMMKRMETVLPEYRQVQIQTETEDVTALINKKGKATVKIHPKTQTADTARSWNVSADRLAHNRTRRYLLPEGTPVPFLVDLGVMTKEGEVVRKRYDKFRQINRFLEFVEDILGHLPKDREVTILDFGCGKSYLTFAMYYYLKMLKNYDIRIIGLDLKKDVIRHCNQLAKRYEYEKLHFYEGAIEDYEGVDQVDMVVTLHACDTATDYALYKAVHWGAEVILSVPCCQHELNKQIDREGYNSVFGTVLDYGILKDRFAAMATDGIRAKLLESVGYDTQILEFIDMEHTPKNLLIRAVNRHKEKIPTVGQAETASAKKVSDVRTNQEVSAGHDLDQFMNLFHVKPTLAELLSQDIEGERRI